MASGGSDPPLTTALLFLPAIKTFLSPRIIIVEKKIYINVLLLRLLFIQLHFLVLLWRGEGSAKCFCSRAQGTLASSLLCISLVDLLVMKIYIIKQHTDICFPKQVNVIFWNRVILDFKLYSFLDILLLILRFMWYPNFGDLNYKPEGHTSPYRFSLLMKNNY